jgi:glycosyltransferase involved in cell wall biosynthesis
MKEHSEYIPHAVNHDIFKPYDQTKIKNLRRNLLPKHKDKFIVFYNSRNARRKMTSDIMKTVKLLADDVGQDKVFLLMHTDPHDPEGSNLFEVAAMLGLTNDQVSFSNQKLPPDKVADMYNMADITMNISYNEGFGLSCLESLSCGTPVIINKTGGLQDQPVDDKGNVFGVVVEPASRTLVGSQQVPYIYDDRCSSEDLLKAIKQMYSMSSEDRFEMGQQAAKWARKAFSIDNMISKWDEALRKYITEFKEGGYKNRIRTMDV